MASPIRVAFAGLAHSHPFTDAANLLTLGAEIVGVFDHDRTLSAEFASRFGGRAVPDAARLQSLDADICVATPRPHHVVPLARSLTSSIATMPVFFNKVIAATPRQLWNWEQTISLAAVPVGTSSVLRFAPALEDLAERVLGREVFAIRVRAQHDNAAFQTPERSWQDDPDRGGGTMLTVGIHAWEMVDRVLPGAELEAAGGWTRRRLGSRTRSEDAAGVSGLLRLPGCEQRVPVHALVTGSPGPDAYAIDVVTADGMLSVDLDGEQPNLSLGFLGLAQELQAAARARAVPAPWEKSRTVVINAIRAGAAGRNEKDPSETWIWKNSDASASQRKTRNEK